MAITLEQAKALKYKQTVIDNRGKRWYVNGAVKTWKRSPERVQVPVKHGLYVYRYLTEDDLGNLTLEQ